MKSAYFTTIVMGIIAAITMAVAAFNYPWPETVTQNAQVSKPLFENYETTAVRNIEVTAYDNDRSDVQRLRLKRSGQNWVVPQKSGFDVTGDQRVLQVTRALNDRIVLEVNSDSQTDHVNFGVLDPSDVGVNAARSRLGTKLVLADRDQKTIAHIIVGDPVKNSPGKHYVRIPGKPTIYSIEFDRSILTTDFAKWVDPNLLKLPINASGGLSLDQFTINRHRLDLKTKKDQSIYTAELKIDDQQRLKATALTVAGKKTEISQLPNGFAESAVRALYLLRPTDVEKQNKSVIEALQQPQPDDSNSLSTIAERGFLYQGFKNEGHQFTGTNGEVSVLRSDGVRLTVVIGELANRIGGDSLSLLYQAMVRAEIEPDAFAEIEEIESADESEQKAYLREVKQRTEAIEAAKRQVQQINRTHSQWIYVFDESVIKGLFPEIGQ